jgi:competence protein ComEA
MKQRIIEFLKNTYIRLRPFLLLLLIGLAVFLAKNLSEVYVERPAEPLTKLADIKGLNSQIEESSPSGDQIMRVSITGSVVNPGVYELDSGAIVQELIRKAGGLSKEADKAYISVSLNLARKLSDGEQIYIPGVNEQKLISLIELKDSASTSDPSSGGSDDQVDKKVNINTASKSELETLPGVGPSTAQKIIDNRPYKTIEDIKNVSGIGDATFEKLKDLILV